MYENINSIVRMFPDFEERIDFLFQADEMFRDLCKDYILCASTLLDIKKEKNKDKSRVEEYEELQWNLEQEILQRLTKDKNNTQF